MSILHPIKTITAWVIKKQIQNLEVAIAADKTSLEYWGTKRSAENSDSIPVFIGEKVDKLRRNIAANETRLGHLKNET